MADPDIELHLPSDMTRSCRAALDKPDAYFLANWFIGLVYFMIYLGFLGYFVLRIRVLNPKY